ncbi:chitin deacetylase [Entophlyctis luteolus]|nr:chitin deacetylase [Entophlyctis luteolus]
MSTTEQLPPLKFLDNPFDSAPLPGNLRKKTISSCTSDSSGGSELGSLNLQVASSEIGTVIVDAKIDKVRVGLGAMPDVLRRKFDVISYSPTIANSDRSSQVVISGRDSVKSHESGASSIFMNGLQKNLERYAENKPPECRPEALAEISASNGILLSVPLDVREAASGATTPTVGVGSSSIVGTASTPSLVDNSGEYGSETPKVYMDACHSTPLPTPDQYATVRVPAVPIVPRWTAFVESLGDNETYPWINVPVSSPNHDGESTAGGPNGAGAAWGSPENKATEVFVCPDAHYALTFDDGPGLTPSFMKLLDDNGVVGTFFLIGANVVSDPAHAQYVKDLYAAGHQIGLHTWTHRPISLQSNEELISEIIFNILSIYNIIGKVPRYFRPPCEDGLQRV